jgi:hypothetical protein
MNDGQNLPVKFYFIIFFFKQNLKINDFVVKIQNITITRSPGKEDTLRLKKLIYFFLSFWRKYM